MKRTRSTSVAFSLGAVTTLGAGLLGPAPAFADTFNGPGSCPTAAETQAKIQKQAQSDPAVKAATAAHHKHLKVVARTVRAEHDALVAYRRAQASHTTSVIVATSNAFKKAKAARIAAQSAEHKARVRLNAVTASVKTRLLQTYVSCSEILSAPTAVQVQAGNDSAKLSWAAVPGIDSYHVYRDGVLVGWSSTTEFEDDTASNGTTYNYTVRSLDQSYESPDSIVAPVVPQLPPPVNVSAFTNDGNVSVTWDAVPHATDYSVTCDGKQLGSTSDTTFTHVATGAVAAHVYAVIASEHGVDSTPSAGVTAQQTWTTPAAVTNLAANVSSSQVTLTWTADPSALTWNVFRDGVQIATAVSAATYVDTSVVNDTSYSYQVQAVNPAGSSALSDAVAATPRPLAPATPTGLVVVPKDTGASVSWAAVVGATSYQVYVNGTLAATTSTLAASLTGLTNDVAVGVTVTASNSGGISAPTSAVTVIPRPAPPATPSGLAATASSTQVALTWAATSRATSYGVYINGVIVGSTNATSWVASGLTDGQSYSFAIDARNTGGVSAQTATVTATPAPAVPPTPANVTATAGDKQITLSWTASARATSYVVKSGTTTVSTTANTTVTLTGLTNGTTYTYTVTAVNVGGSSTPSAPVSVTPLSPLPAAPSSLTASAGNASVSLSWGAVSGATGYRVYRGGTFVAATTSTSYTVTGLTNGTTYTFTVRSTNASGTSTGSSPSATATPLAPPATPTNVVVTPGDSSLAVSWTASATATSYGVYVNGTLATTATTTSASVTGLSNGTSYSVTVVAINASGSSTASAAVTATPLPPIPAQPTNLVALAGNAQVTLSWTSVSGAASYDIYRDGALVATTTLSSWADTLVTNGTTYNYQIAARNLGGASALTASVAATPTGTAPGAPSAPTGVGVTAGNASATVTWSAVSGAASYQVLVNGTVSVTTATTSAAVSGLTNGTTYSFTVVAVNGGGSSPASAAVTATPQPPAPAAPTGLTATGGNAQVVLSWTASAGATSYSVYQGSTLLTTTSATTYTATGLTNGTSYSFTVVATNGGGSSPASTAATATPQPPAPAAPTGLTASAGNAQVVLSWSASAGATSYSVYQGSTLLTTTSATTYTATGLTNGTSYSFTVVATNGGGSSQASTAATATPQPPAPAAPTGLTATAGNAQVVLSWTASAGATSYSVYQGSTLVTTTSALTYTVAGLTNGTAYSFTVVATNGGGSSPASTAASATPQPPAPAAPTNVVATAGNTQVTLTWTASSGATSYQVYNGATLVTTGTSTSSTITGLTNGTAYSFTVVAVNGGGSSPASTAVTATPQPPAPAAPTGLTATSGNTQVSLAWTASAGATSYQVFNGSTLLTTTTSTSYTVTGLVNGTGYTFTVVAVNGGGSSPASAAVSATPAAPVLAAPTNVVVDSSTALLTGALRINWTAVPTATSYSVYRDGTLLGTSTTTNYVPTSTPIGSQHTYTVVASNATLTSVASAGAVSGVYSGTVVNDASGRTVYGQIQVFLVVTSTVTKSTTGCWATYPTTSDSGQINPTAIPQLCSQVLTKQPTSANATTLITNASGASCTSPAFKTSLAAALTSAGM